MRPSLSLASIPPFPRLFTHSPLPRGDAQVKLPANTSITLPGQDTEVDDDMRGGARPNNGLNLFPSFGEFSIAPHHIANFLNETSLSIFHIFSVAPFEADSPTSGAAFGAVVDGGLDWSGISRSGDCFKDKLSVA